MSDDDDDDIREFSNHDDYASENVTKKYISILRLLIIFIVYLFFLVTQIKIKRYKRC